MNQQKICTICAIPIPDNYCSKCGQKVSEKPTTTFSLIGDFLSNFFSLEKSVFATIVRVLLNPKLIVVNYYNGFRNYYASPGKILLYGIAVVALHVSFVHKNIMGLSLDVENINTQYLFWLILFPFLLLISYLTFIRTEKKLAKHIISITYISSALFILLTIVNDAIIMLIGDKLELWAFIIFIILVFFSNSRVLTNKKKNISIALNTLFQIAIFIALIGVIVLITNQFGNK